MDPKLPLHEQLPAWMRDRPSWPLWGALGGIALLLILNLLELVGKGETAVHFWYCLDTPTARRIGLIVGVLLPVVFIGIPTVFTGFGWDLTKTWRIRKKTKEGLRRAMNHLQDVNDTLTSQAAGRLQQKLVIRHLRMAAMEGITPAWLDEPLGKRAAVNGAWVAVAEALSIKYPEAVVHPSQVVGRGAKRNPDGTTTYFTTPDEMHAWKQYSLGVIDTIIRECLTPQVRRRITPNYSLVDQEEEGLPLHADQSANVAEQTLLGVRAHLDGMLNELPSKFKELGKDGYEDHMDTVIIAAGNGLQRARELGLFDDCIDLLNILDGVDRGEYGWQSGILSSDRFQGFWFWLKKNAPAFSKRGDYRVFTMQMLVRMIDTKITSLRH